MSIEGVGRGEKSLENEMSLLRKQIANNEEANRVKKAQLIALEQMNAIDVQSLYKILTRINSDEGSIELGGILFKFLKRTTKKNKQTKECVVVHNTTWLDQNQKTQIRTYLTSAFAEVTMVNFKYREND